MGVWFSIVKILFSDQKHRRHNRYYMLTLGGGSPTDAFVYRHYDLTCCFLGVVSRPTRLDVIKWRDPRGKGDFRGKSGYSRRIGRLRTRGLHGVDFTSRNSLSTVVCIFTSPPMRRAAVFTLSCTFITDVVQVIIYLFSFEYYWSISLQRDPYSLCSPTNLFYLSHDVREAEILLLDQV